MALSTLSPDILKNFAQLLNLKSLLKLFFLVGCKHLESAATRYGSITSIYIEDGQELRIFVNSGFLPFLRQLTSLEVHTVASNPKDVMQLKDLDTWMTLLPPTLREIRLTSPNALNFLLRPVHPLNDDDFTKLVARRRDLTVINVKQHFPELRILRVSDRQDPPSDAWNECMHQAFLNQLPPTLTSLHYPMYFTYVDNHRTVLLPPKETVQRLQELLLEPPLNNEFSYRSLDLNVLKLFDDQTPRGLEDDPSDLAHLQQLHKLQFATGLKDSLSEIASLSNLRSFTLITTTLTSKIPDEGLPLPCNLTELDWTTEEDGPGVPATLLRLPHLLRLSLSTSRITKHRAGAPSIKHLPPNLTELKVAHFGNSLRCAFPQTLTSVYLAYPMSFTDLASVKGLLHLRTGFNFDVEIASWPNLRSLGILSWSNWPPPPPTRYLPLPKTLIEFRAPFVLQQPQYEDLKEMTIWTPPSVTEAVRQCYFPQILPANFHPTISVQQKFYDSMQTAPLTVYEFHALFSALTLVRSMDDLQQYQMLTRCYIDDINMELDLDGLPPGLVDFTNLGESLYTPHFSSKPKSRNSPAATILPATLKTLFLQRLKSKVDVSESEGAESAAALFRTVPLLERLFLPNYPVPAYETVLSLPSTITYLTIGVVPTGWIDSLSPSEKWLPHLRCLRVMACPLRYRNLQPHLQQLDALETQYLIMEGADLGSFDGAELDELILHSHCMGLLPLHLRSCKIRFLIESTRESLAHLFTARLQKLRMPRYTFFKGPPPVSLSTLPLTITKLELPKGSYFRLEGIAKQLPRTLKKLKCDWKKGESGDFSDLPRGLTWLSITAIHLPHIWGSTHFGDADLQQLPDELECLKLKDFHIQAPLASFPDHLTTLVISCDWPALNLLALPTTMRHLRLTALQSDDEPSAFRKLALAQLDQLLYFGGADGRNLLAHWSVDN